MITNTRDFELGEKKYIDYEIIPKNTGDTVVISSATWQLIKGTTVEATGNCEIDGATVSALIQPLTTGRYTLAVTVEVAPEIIVEKCAIEVK